MAAMRRRRCAVRGVRPGTIAAQDQERKTPRPVQQGRLRVPAEFRARPQRESSVTMSGRVRSTTERDALVTDWPRDRARGRRAAAQIPGSCARDRREIRRPSRSVRLGSRDGALPGDPPRIERQQHRHHHVRRPGLADVPEEPISGECCNGDHPRGQWEPAAWGTVEHAPP